MGKRTGMAVLSTALLVGVVGVLVAHPTVGEAAGAASSETKLTLSATKDYTPSPWTSEVGYGKRAVAKLGFGLKNLLLGWTSLVTEPMDASKSGENVLKGVGIGLKNAVENELGGAVHVLTFAIPQIDAPLPKGGVQLMSS